MIRKFRFLRKLGLAAVFVGSGLDVGRAQITGQTTEGVGYGNVQDRQVRGNSVLLFDAAAEKSLDAICSRIAMAADSHSPPPKCLIINSPGFNAYATVGHYVFVTAGLLDFAVCRDEVAGCLAHEITHRLHHDAETSLQKERAAIKRGQVIEGAIIVVGAAAGVATGGLGTMAVPAFAQGTSLAGTIALSNGLMLASTGMTGINLSMFPAQKLYAVTFNDMVLGYSTEVEERAEAQVVPLMRRAGYDPERYMALLKRMSEDVKKDPTVNGNLLHSTLPLKKRIEIIEKALETDQ